MAANQRVVEVKDANRISEFQLNMALETEALELDSPLVHQAVEYLIGQPQYGYYLANRNSDGVVPTSNNHRSPEACYALSKTTEVGGFSQFMSPKSSVSRVSSLRCFTL